MMNSAIESLKINLWFFPIIYIIIWSKSSHRFALLLIHDCWQFFSLFLKGIIFIFDFSKFDNHLNLWSSEGGTGVIIAISKEGVVSLDTDRGGYIDESWVEFEGHKEVWRNWKFFLISKSYL